MDDPEYTRRLEGVIRQMMVPLRGIPFNLVIETLTGHKVLAYDQQNPLHHAVLGILIRAARLAGQEVNRSPILRLRPNEVGNDIEPFVKRALNSLGLRSGIPEDRSGKHRTMGYPDILFWSDDHPFYLECKTFNRDNADTSQRSFYLSPAEDMKITRDAIHFLLSFEIYVSGRVGQKNEYRCNGYKLLSLESLSVDVKYEFNSDNARLYSGRDGARILAEETIK